MAASNATIVGLRRVAFTVNATQFSAAIADANAVSGESYPTDPAAWRLGHWNVEAEGALGGGVAPPPRTRLAPMLLLLLQARGRAAWGTRSRASRSRSSEAASATATATPRPYECRRTIAV